MEKGIISPQNHINKNMTFGGGLQMNKREPELMEVEVGNKKYKIEVTELNEPSDEGIEAFIKAVLENISIPIEYTLKKAI